MPEIIIAEKFAKFLLIFFGEAWDIGSNFSEFWFKPQCKKFKNFEGATIFFFLLNWVSLSKMWEKFVGNYFKLAFTGTKFEYFKRACCT